MKLENRINKYIKQVQNTDNVVDRSWYLTKLNECKEELLNILQSNDFIMKDLKNNDTYIRCICKKYNIKNIYFSLNNSNSIFVINLDFNI